MKPPRLFKGARLGVIAPSSPITASEKHVQRGYERLRDLGLEIQEHAQCRKRVGHAAGSIQERVDAIHSFFSDKNIHGIMAFWGGYQSHQLLEYLDYDLIKKNPKVLIGYSDITSLSVGIYARAGLVGFSGPCVISFCKTDLPDYTVRSFESVVMGKERPLYQAADQFSDNAWWQQDQMEWEKQTGWKCFQKGKVSGTLVGGNVGTMLLLQGTEYWPSLKDAILFIEDDEAEKPQTINRFLTQLRQIGVFKQIRGLMIGRFPRCVGFRADDSFEMILRDVLKGYDFPVLYDIDYGHTDPLLTFPLGIRAELDAEKRQIQLLEDAVL